MVICSIGDDFINDFVRTLLMSENLCLNNQNISVEEVKTSEERTISESVKVITLSPIVTYSTVTIEEKKKTVYHSPEDGIF